MALNHSCVCVLIASATAPFAAYVENVTVVSMTSLDGVAFITLSVSTSVIYHQVPAIIDRDKWVDNTHRIPFGIEHRIRGLHSEHSGTID